MRSYVESVTFCNRLEDMMIGRRAYYVSSRSYHVPVTLIWEAWASRNVASVIKIIHTILERVNF